MMTLPQLPTDKLYKLSTFGGLAMLLAGIYFVYARNLPFDETGNGAYAKTVFLTDQLIDVGLNPKDLPDSTTDENPMERYIEYRDLIRTLPITHSKREELRTKNEELLVRRLANRQRVFVEEGRHVNVLALLFSGASFFLLGVVWWSLDDRYREALEQHRAAEARYLKMLEILPKRGTSETIAVSDLKNPD